MTQTMSISPVLGELENTSTTETDRVNITAAGVAIAAGVVLFITYVSPLFGAYLGIVSALIALHEAGHLVAARRCGLAVSEYAVGFGPTILSFRARNITWSLRSLPIGGFVHIYGPTPESEVPDHIDPSTTLVGTTRLRRVITIAAGPAANLVAAVLLSAFAFGVVGVVTADGSRERTGPGETITAAVGDLTGTTAATLNGLGAIVSDTDGYASAVVSGNRDEAPAAFMSPVGASNLIGELQDPHLLLRFAAIISIGLGVFNLLPLPPLDGGHLAVELINTIRSRIRGALVRTSTKTLNYASLATIACFVLLTVTALRFDLAG